MIEESRKTSGECKSVSISAYVDGELSRIQECELERHFATCAKCREEINFQKTVLLTLNSSLERGGEPEIPKNFARLVIATAETRVDGLRRSGEKRLALAICLGLAAFSLLLLGPDHKYIIAAGFGFIEAIASVVSYTLHFLYDIALGLVVISRSLLSVAAASSLMALAFFALFFAAAVYSFSWFILRHPRT
ncbi:MAG: zf-HC2 domain-containing protein [Acidobacteria bacterium]|nr:zf-HC2 domain-containing protein [Acidobacteriota bacterium]MCA1609151.1 zf-HC2 domain-containing protein [Acidobacteriota bacterium]